MGGGAHLFTDAYLQSALVQQGPQISPISVLGLHLAGRFLGQSWLGPISRPGPVALHVAETEATMPRTARSVAMLNCIIAIVLVLVGFLREYE